MSGRDRKREDFLRATGRGLLARGAEVERALHRVRSFHARGMTYVQMADQIGIPVRTLTCAISEDRNRLKRRTLVALERLRFEAPAPHSWVEPTGTRRRLGALWLEGYPLPWLAEALPFRSRGYLQAVIRGSKGQAGLTYANATAVAELYDKLDGQDPAGMGVDPRSVKYATTCAHRKGCVPRSCWDPDTLDDPAAIPQWTGRCGTAFGWLIHRRDEIPLCQPCLDAAQDFTLDWKRLRELREESGLSQERLAEAADMKVYTYRNWECGRTDPRFLGQLDAVLAVLDVTYEEVCRTGGTVPRFGRKPTSLN